MLDTSQFITDLRNQAKLAAVKGKEYDAYFYGTAADRLAAAEDVVDAARGMEKSVTDMGSLIPDEAVDFYRRETADALARHDKTWGGLT